jgi:purine-nucleoside phosphorylase
MIDKCSLFDQADAAAYWIRARAPGPWRAGVVLGSGLGALADRVAEPIALPFQEIPHFPQAGVPGHAGRLVLGTLAGVPTAVLQGRVHSYEGHDLARVAFSMRVLQRLGVPTVILTAAAGGIRPDLSPGNLVCVTDHLNLLASSPLRGANDDRLGPRFPDMSAVYSQRLRDLAASVARELDIPLSEGVYAAVQGPQYETPAEIRMLRTLGADVVGMSTTPEAIAARHGGLEVLALVIVTNHAAGVTAQPLDHAEVLAAGQAMGPRLGRLIEEILARLDSGN